MAAQSDLELAARLLCQLNAHQSQGSLASQANDCWLIVQALGYYDLADHLKRMGSRTENVDSLIIEHPTNKETP